MALARNSDLQSVADQQSARNGGDEIEAGNPPAGNEQKYRVNAVTSIMIARLPRLVMFSATPRIQAGPIACRDRRRVVTPEARPRRIAAFRLPEPPGQRIASQGKRRRSLRSPSMYRLPDCLAGLRDTLSSARRVVSRHQCDPPAQLDQRKRFDQVVGGAAAHSLQPVSYLIECRQDDHRGRFAHFADAL